MDNPRPEKVAVVDEVRTRLDGAESVVLTEYRGLDVPAIAELRSAVKAAGGDYKIYKNSLVRFAVRDLGLDLEELLVGPTALAFTAPGPDGRQGDPVSLAKALADFAKTNDALVIKGGLLGDRVLEVDEIRELARIAPRDELLARFAGGLAAPLQRFAGLLAALPRNFAYALQALIDERGGVEEPAADDAAEPTAEPAADDGAEPAVEEPAADHAAEPAADDAAEPAVEEPADDAAEPAEAPAEAPATETTDAEASADTTGADAASDDSPEES